MPKDSWPNAKGDDVWKYSAIWFFNAACAITASLADVSSPHVVAVEDPISAGYSGAQLISQLTDRGLWLFFLGIILAYSYWNDRKKDKEIIRLQGKQDAVMAAMAIKEERLISTLSAANNLMDRIERRLDQ
jgi:uncharacterized protein (DUF2225 family)